MSTSTDGTRRSSRASSRGRQRGRGRVVVMGPFLSGAVCGTVGTDNAVGAQTGRRGGAGPAGALLGGENAPAARLQSHVVEQVNQNTGRLLLFWLHVFFRGLRLGGQL